MTYHLSHAMESRWSPPSSPRLPPSPASVCNCNMAVFLASLLAAAAAASEALAGSFGSCRGAGLGLLLVEVGVEVVPEAVVLTEAGRDMRDTDSRRMLPRRESPSAAIAAALSPSRSTLETANCGKWLSILLNEATYADRGGNEGKSTAFVSLRSRKRGKCKGKKSEW